MPDGRIVTERALFDSPPSRAFRQRDLYSTFFGTSVNDEIERKLFGDVDTRGSIAVKAFAGTDVREWHRHFQTLFEYLDIQKLRTPKGLDWLSAQYPSLSQNALMREMQSIRMLHCTIWTEGVREVVSAEDSEIKFLVSDHPVTLYNHSCKPHGPSCRYPLDPSIALKGSQTLFPLSRNFCLILTNLEYARDPSVQPLEKRIFPRNYKHSMVKTDAFIRSRRLDARQVTQINFILKSRARRFIAAGRKEWLHPEIEQGLQWQDLANTLRPPQEEISLFGGQLYAKFNDGHVHYQDEFGRTEDQRSFLVKSGANALKARDQCGCGSGKQLRHCCGLKSISLRPSWKERSIRERNLMLFNGLGKILRFDTGKDWLEVRKDLTEDQIRDGYLLFDDLWPIETDLLDLLPKPDGTSRAIYSGAIDPDSITEIATGICGYFDEVIVEHPFAHASIINKDFSPVHKPNTYRQEFIKSVVFMIKTLPLIDRGLINLVPDPTNFDAHLRKQMWTLAETRLRGVKIDEKTDKQFRKLWEADFKRGMMSLPRDILKRQFRERSPELSDEELEQMLDTIKAMQEDDPLAPLHSETLDGGRDGGQLHMLKLAPNFEMSMYLAQATGACIVTDSEFRWNEIQAACRWSQPILDVNLMAMKDILESEVFPFFQNPEFLCRYAADPHRRQIVDSFQKLFKYLSNSARRSPKPNLLRNLRSRFSNELLQIRSAAKTNPAPHSMGSLRFLFPKDGIQNNTINRLLLMSSSEHHLSDVPMAIYIKKLDIT